MGWLQCPTVCHHPISAEDQHFTQASMLSGNRTSLQSCRLDFVPSCCKAFFQIVSTGVAVNQASSTYDCRITAFCSHSHPPRRCMSAAKTQSEAALHLVLHRVQAFAEGAACTCNWQWPTKEGSRQAVRKEEVTQCFAACLNKCSGAGVCLGLLLLVQCFLFLVVASHWPWSDQLATVAVSSFSWQQPVPAGDQPPHG